MSSFFNSSGLIQLINRYKIPLIIVTVASVALSIFFSSPIFIKPKFKSFAVVYPSNLIPYSSETPTEQMLQLFKSEDITNAIIRKFELAKHYNIDSTKYDFLTDLRTEFNNNINVRKSEFESIIIDAYDTDPKIACNIVNEIIRLMNLKARELQRSKTAEVVNIYKQQLLVKQHQIDSIQERMRTLRTEFNLFDYTIQVKEYTKSYLKTMGRGNPEVKQTMTNLQQYGGEFLFLGGYLASLSGAYNDIKTEYDKSVSDLTKELTYTNIVTSPYPAETKSYPIRWLIVVITTISALLVTMIVVSIVDNRRSRRKSIETSPQ